MLQPTVLEVTPMADYKLMLTFENGEKKIFDVTPYIDGPWFGKLRDVVFFNSVYIAGKSVKWADGQDISPHELYGSSKPIKETSI